MKNDTCLIADKFFLIKLKYINTLTYIVVGSFLGPGTF